MPCLGLRNRRTYSYADQPGPRCASLEFHVHALHQQPVEAPVVLHQAGALRVGHLAQRVVQRLRRQTGVQPRQRRPQPAEAENVAEACALGSGLSGCEVGPDA
jgi:hypothetical protein